MNALFSACLNLSYLPQQRNDFSTNQTGPTWTFLSPSEREHGLKRGVCQSLSASSPSHCTSAQVFVLANFHYAKIGQVYVSTGDFITVRLLSQLHVTHTQGRGMCSWRRLLDPMCFSISIFTEKEICIRHRSAREEKPRQRAEEFHSVKIKKREMQSWFSPLSSFFM